ncbi:unnamed protein product [Peniophora sp. CBMAI 1063]|nr:unnamed protein product [Peniophora sp. CBMAI 1063]
MCWLLPSRHMRLVKHRHVRGRSASSAHRLRYLDMPRARVALRLEYEVPGVQRLVLCRSLPSTCVSDILHRIYADNPSVSICNIHTVASSRIVLTSPTSCDTISQFCFTLSTTFTRIAIVLSFIMRAYVVVPKVFIAYLAIGFLAVVGLMSIILDVVQTAQMSCTEASNPLPPPAFVVTFLSLLVFDVLSSALITWGVIRMISDMGGFRRLSSQHIGKLIIRSGALYFFIITGLQIASIVIYWLPQGVYSLVLNNWLITLSAVLVTHFLLDLRELVHGRTENSGSSSNLPTMAFAKSPGAKKDGFDISLGLVDDFTDDTFELTDTSGVRTQDDREWARHAGGDESAQVTSMAWPLEDLAARARRVEEELGFTEQL